MPDAEQYGPPEELTEELGLDSPDPAPSNGQAGDPRRTLLNRLSELHKDVKADRHLDLDIPGYEGMLFARFRPYEVSRTERRVKSMQRAMERNQPVILMAACDTLIESCEQFYVRDEQGKELPIDDIVPVRFEKRLAELLHFPNLDHITEARHVVLELFPTQQSILKASTDISQWLNTASSEADEDFLGESEGTR